MTIELRRVYNQPPRDDYLTNERLGLATMRTDHLDGSATFDVLEAPDGLRGLYLDTGATIVRAGGRFTLTGPQMVVTRTLDRALLAFTLNTRATTSPNHTLTAAAA